MSEFADKVSEIAGKIGDTVTGKNRKPKWHGGIVELPPQGYSPQSDVELHPQGYTPGRDVDLRKI